MCMYSSEFKESDKKYYHLVNSILDVIIELNLNLKITYINPQAYDVFGYSPEELLGKRTSDFIHPDDIPKATKAFKRTKKSKLIISEEVRIQHKQGYYIHVSVRGGLMKDNNDTRIIAVLRDITEKKKTEELLKESEKKFRTIFNSIPDIFFLVDQDSTILEYSGKQEDLYVSPEEFLGKKMIEVLPSDLSKLSKEAIDKTITSGRPQVIEYSLPINDNMRYFEARHLHFAENKVAIFIRNITERIIATQKLKKSEDEYREAYYRAELYKDLFYHDINNICSNIKFSIDLSEIYLNEPGKEREIKDLYNVIREQFIKSQKLISNVKKLSNREGSNTSLKSINAGKTLDEAIQFIKNSLPTKSINFNIELLEKEFFVIADELLIDIFDNILINAVKYNDNPQIEIFIKTSRKESLNKRYIKFEFMDNGIGITDRKKGIIFQERFCKENGSKGMGFGLTLVKQVIESYSGEIWVEDRVKGDYSKGSNFAFLIPESVK